MNNIREKQIPMYNGIKIYPYVVNHITNYDEDNYMFVWDEEDLYDGIELDKKTDIGNVVCIIPNTTSGGVIVKNRNGDIITFDYCGVIPNEVKKNMISEVINYIDVYNKFQDNTDLCLEFNYITDLSFLDKYQFDDCISINRNNDDTLFYIGTRTDTDNLYVIDEKTNSMRITSTDELMEIFNDMPNNTNNVDNNEWNDARYSALPLNKNILVIINDNNNYITTVGVIEKNNTITLVNENKKGIPLTDLVYWKELNIPNLNPKSDKEQVIENAIKGLKAAINNPDHEVAHIEADDILCNVLTALGYDEIVQLYSDVAKWYA